MDKNILETAKYQFLKTDSFFVKHPICYLTVAGSHAYGTNIESSDVDIRGFYLDDIKELLTFSSIREEYIDKDSDTVIFSFRKIIKLLINCNPNIIELLGTNNILFQNKIGKTVRDNYRLFLSLRAYNTFCGYAREQLNRLTYKNISSIEEEQRIEYFRKHIIDYVKFNYNDIISINFDKDGYIFCDIHADNIDFAYLTNCIKQLNEKIIQFNKLNHRNRKHDEAHIFKHAMHLVRLYYMGIDILESQQINTFRKKEHNLLMDIRLGKKSMQEIFDLQKELQTKIDYAYKNSTLPKQPDINKINQLMLDIYFA